MYQQLIDQGDYSHTDFRYRWLSKKQKEFLDTFCEVFATVLHGICHQWCQDQQPLKKRLVRLPDTTRLECSVLDNGMTQIIMRFPSRLRSCTNSIVKQSKFNECMGAVYEKMMDLCAQDFESLPLDQQSAWHPRSIHVDTWYGLLSWRLVFDPCPQSWSPPSIRAFIGDSWLECIST